MASIVTLSILLVSFVLWNKISLERLKRKADEFIAMYEELRLDIGSNENSEYEFRSKNYNIIMKNGDYQSFWLYTRVCAVDVILDYNELSERFFYNQLWVDEILEEYMEKVQDISNKAKIEIWKNGYA